MAAVRRSTQTNAHGLPPWCPKPSIRLPPALSTVVTQATSDDTTITLGSGQISAKVPHRRRLRCYNNPTLWHPSNCDSLSAMLLRPSPRHPTEPPPTATAVGKASDQTIPLHRRQQEAVDGGSSTITRQQPRTQRVRRPWIPQRESEKIFVSK
ncbi:hypothetical protein BHE74_00046405 [Ensete ventricosum]|nr:hypothetical protein BHE74_00046405 [Ensete ventricosum]